MRRFGVIARLLALRALLPVATRRLPLPRLVQLLARPSTNVRRREHDLAVRVSAQLWRASDRPCLQRSLALYSVLGRLGADVTLVCGIARSRATRIGHAWVEEVGTALLEPSDPRALNAPLLVFGRDGSLVDAAVTTQRVDARPTTHESRPARERRATTPAIDRPERA